MNPEIKTEWVRRLRSGDYVQGTKFLQTKEDKYCCLGVLCAIAAEQGVVESHLYKPFDGRGDEQVYKYGKEFAILPNEVVAWSGLPTEDPKLNSHRHTDDGFVSLSEINDDYQLSFPEIADMIEEQL